MGCEQYNELICAVLDGEASVEEREALFSHMEECDECRALFDRFRVVSREMQNMEVNPPEFLVSGILYKIGLEGQQKRRPFAFGRFTALAAAVVLVLFIGRSVLPRLTGAEADTANETMSVKTLTETYSGTADGGEDVALELTNGDTVADAPLPESAPADTPAPDNELVSGQLAAEPVYDAAAELESWETADQTSYYCACILVDVQPAELDTEAELIDYQTNKRTYRANRSLVFSFEQKYQIQDVHFDDMMSEDAIIVLYFSEGGPIDG